MFDEDSISFTDEIDKLKRSGFKLTRGRPKVPKD